MISWHLNETIAVIMVYLVCHEVKYSGRKDPFFEDTRNNNTEMKERLSMNARGQQRVDASGMK